MLNLCKGWGTHHAKVLLKLAAEIIQSVPRGGVGLAWLGLSLSRNVGHI